MIDVSPVDRVLHSGKQEISNQFKIEMLFPIVAAFTMLFLILAAVLVLVGLSSRHPSQKSEIPQRRDASQSSPQRTQNTEIYSTLGIASLPEGVAGSGPIRRPIEQLSRERCDREAIFDLATALQSAGYRREAANALVTFSRTCGGYAPALRQAANFLLQLSDYSGVETVASELINLEPLYDNGYYLRALARDGSGLAEKAIDDYVTAIELFGDKDQIFSTSYFNMAHLYEKLGRLCDAVLPIEAWVSLNPKHDTSQTRTIIANYMTKGRCTTSGSPEVFAISRPNNIVNLPVTGIVPLDVEIGEAALLALSR